MPDYVRRHVPGGTYFFTVVTASRSPWLCQERARELLRASIEKVRTTKPFTLEAIVLLPDHLHAIWTLPKGDADFSSRWAAIKGLFSKRWVDIERSESAVTADHRRQGRRGVWQPRFIEHAIRDEDDLIQHVEYVHFNPVKHGLVACPKDWPWSSFHRFVREGIYDENWCCGRSAATAGPLLSADWLE